MTKKIDKLGKRVLELFDVDSDNTGPVKGLNYAAIVNELPELFAPESDWTILGKDTLFPKFSEQGKKVFYSLYGQGKLICDFPGLSPTTLQNYFPRNMQREYKGALSYGLMKEQESKNHED